MPCRVGITTSPAQRKAYWEKQVVGLSGWKILASYKKKEDALAHQAKHAERYGCKSQAGGPDTAGDWSVYKFEYIRKKNSTS